MTNGMKQAEREIAQRWLIRTGFLGPITGGISERDLDTEHLYVHRTLKCSDRRASAVVIAMATDGKTLHETAIKNLPSEPTIRRRWHRGLALYCELNGLPRD